MKYSLSSKSLKFWLCHIRLMSLAANKCQILCVYVCHHIPLVCGPWFCSWPQLLYFSILGDHNLSFWFSIWFSVRKYGWLLSHIGYWVYLCYFEQFFAIPRIKNYAIFLLVISSFLICSSGSSSPSLPFFKLLSSSFFTLGLLHHCDPKDPVSPSARLAPQGWFSSCPES